MAFSCRVISPARDGDMSHAYCALCRMVEMEGKGWGIVADEDILPGSFVMEYIGQRCLLHVHCPQASSLNAHCSCPPYFVRLSWSSIRSALHKLLQIRQIVHPLHFQHADLLSQQSEVLCAIACSGCAYVCIVRFQLDSQVRTG